MEQDENKNRRTRGGEIMKEAYVKPTVKSEILKAEVLCDNWGSGSNYGQNMPGMVRH